MAEKKEQKISYSTENVNNYLLSYTCKEYESRLLTSCVFEWANTQLDTSKVYDVLYVLDGSGSMNDPIASDEKDDEDEPISFSQMDDIPTSAPPGVYLPKKAASLPKITLVKRAIVKTLEFIVSSGIRVKLYISSFNLKTTVLFNEILTKDNFPALKQKLKQEYIADDGTNIHVAMTDAFKQIDQLPEQSRKEAKVFLMTDGKNTSDKDDPLLVELVSNSPYKSNVFTIGIGKPTDYNGDLLGKISDRVRAGITGIELNDHIIGLSFNAMSQIAKELVIQFPKDVDILCPFEMKENAMKLTNVNFSQKLVFFCSSKNKYLEFVLFLDGSATKKKILLIPTPDKTFCVADQHLVYKYCKLSRIFTEMFQQKDLTKVKLEEKIKLLKSQVDEELEKPLNNSLKIYPMWEAFTDYVNKYAEQVKTHYDMGQIMLGSSSAVDQIASCDYSQVAKTVMLKAVSQAPEKTKIECVICADKIRNVVFFPCLHLVSCEVCYKKLKKCPTCSKEVITIVKCFLEEKNSKMLCGCGKQSICTMLSPCRHVTTCEGCARVAIFKGCPTCKKPVKEYMKIFR